jgi:hypothetical protein
MWVGIPYSSHTVYMTRQNSIIKLNQVIIVELFIFFVYFQTNTFFCSTLSEFENFLLCERILINVTTVKTKRQANFEDFKRFGAFKGLVKQKNVVFNSIYTRTR